MKELWREYNCELEILDRIYGGLPKSPEILEGFVKGKNLPPDMLERLKEEMGTDKAIEEDIEGSWTGFKSDDTGIYIETRQIKAMLKEAVGESELWKDIRGLKSRVAGAVFPKGQGGTDLSHIYLNRDNGPITEPDGWEETVGHVTGPQGRRSILKRKDYVEKPTIKFTMKVGGKTVKKSVLEYLLGFGEELGLGADRSMEHGKFKVTKFEQIV
jgi:hypothetical protein